MRISIRAPVQGATQPLTEKMQQFVDISIRAPVQGATPYIAQPDNSKHNMYVLTTRFYFWIALTQVKISAKRPALFGSLSLRTQNKGGDDYILIHAPA